MRAPRTSPCSEIRGLITGRVREDGARAEHASPVGEVSRPTCEIQSGHFRVESLEARGLAQRDTPGVNLVRDALDFLMLGGPEIIIIAFVDVARIRAQQPPLERTQIRLRP